MIDPFGTAGASKSSPELLPVGWRRLFRGGVVEIPGCRQHLAPALVALSPPFFFSLLFFSISLSFIASLSVSLPYFPLCVSFPSLRSPDSSSARRPLSVLLLFLLLSFLVSIYRLFYILFGSAFLYRHPPGGVVASSRPRYLRSTLVSLILFLFLLLFLRHFFLTLHFLFSFYPSLLFLPSLLLSFLFLFHLISSLSLSSLFTFSLSFFFFGFDFPIFFFFFSLSLLSFFIVSTLSLYFSYFLFTPYLSL